MIDNVSIDLQNRMFKEATKLEEFLAVKWTMAALRLIKGTVKLKNSDQNRVVKIDIEETPNPIPNAQA